MIMLKQIVAGLMLSCLASLSFAQDYVLRVTNDTVYDIYHLYVSHEKTDEWEEDLLDEDEIFSPGQSIRIDLEDYNSPWFDVRAVDEKDNAYERYGINVSKEDVSFTKRDLVKP